MLDHDAVVLPAGATSRWPRRCAVSTRRWRTTARSLGLGSGAHVRRVVLPQLRPALLGGALLVALHLLAEFGALQMLRFPTFTTAIYDQYRSTFNGAAANMLAGVLVALCLLALLLEHVARGARPSALRVGSAASPRRPRPSAWARSPPARAARPGGALAGAGARRARSAAWCTGCAWARRRRSRSDDCSSTSLGVARSRRALGAGVDGRRWPCRSPGSQCASPGRSARCTERATYVGHALPGIVVALALVTVAIRWPSRCTRRLWMLLAAYAILFFPLAMVAIRTVVRPGAAGARRRRPVTRASRPLRSFAGSPCPSSRRASARARRWCSSPS